VCLFRSVVIDKIYTTGGGFIGVTEG